MRRVLRSLTLHLWQPRKGGIELIVGEGVEQPKGTKPPAGKKWCDVRTGDHVTVAGKTWNVAVVRIMDCDPANDIGSRVESGRHWLATGEIAAEGEQYATP